MWLPMSTDIKAHIRCRAYFHRSRCLVGRRSVATNCSRPILLKKSVCPNCLIIEWRKRLFCTLLREIRVRKPLQKEKFSISDAYFSDA